MKIHLYNYSMPIVFSYCEEVLKKMNYQVSYSDYKKGIISVFKSENFSSLSSLLDLKFDSEKFSVGITIVSSTMSNIFGNIYFDPVNENLFIENLFEKLEAKKLGNPFKQPGTNYIEAIAC